MRRVGDHRLTVRFVCGHKVRIQREFGIVDPQRCLCAACHPHPVHDQPAICPRCLGVSEDMVLTLQQPCCALSR